MSTVTIRGARLVVHPTRAERVLGRVRDLDVPLASIRSASIVSQWRVARGVRVGAALPRLWLAGSWYSPGRRQLVLLRRGVPALHLVLHGQRFHEVLVSTREAESLLRRLDATEVVGSRGRAPDPLLRGVVPGSPNHEGA